jgi:SpoVK/Ycf46/Vps4 family AAA+-type ATPase
MRIDISGPLYAALEKTIQEYQFAKTQKDVNKAKEKAKECANLLRNLAKVIPEQRTVFIEKANRWDTIADRVSQNTLAQSTSGIQEERKEEDNFTETIESLISESPITWGDIGGLEEVKRLMMETVVIAGLQKPTAIKPWHGVLLFGPPGTGKTLLAAASAGSLNATFYNVKSDSILSKYFGESSKLISTLYDSARKHSPSILFIDEFDSLTRSRNDESSDATRKVLSTILSEMDGFKDKKSDLLLLTLAATNTPWDLDDAVLSRFSRRIYVPLPDAHASSEIIQIHTAGLDITKIKLANLAVQCVERLYSGRDIQNLCQQAILNMIHDKNKELHKLASLPFSELRMRSLQIRPLEDSDFQNAVEKIKSPISRQTLERYEKWNAEFGG